ncbi:MAG TPA: PrsW family glutamic-type intramembrane protease [Phototrophicaceae bacterium]|nr:PrsW family glutamic-type intramembrane protease [Phototrophicaceae bacterium]
MTRSNLSLLTPPQEKEEIHPYRRPWRSLVFETAIVFGVAAVLYALVNILGIKFPPRFYPVIGLGLALLPLGLWLAFSWWPERRVPQPRQRLLTVVIISALVANAIGIPLVNDFLQVDRWLPLDSAINRIIGYTFTAGIIQEMSKYLVLRYTVWTECFRTRLDAVAYAAAAAVGYAVALNWHFLLTSTTPPDVMAGHVLNNLVLNVVSGLIVSYGLAELRFGLPTPLFMTVTIALGAFVTGTAIPVRAGLVNPDFSLGISGPKTLFGLGFAAGLFVAIPLVIAFLYASAERREQEAVEE